MIKQNILSNIYIHRMFFIQYRLAQTVLCTVVTRVKYQEMKKEKVMVHIMANV